MGGARGGGATVGGPSSAKGLEVKNNNNNTKWRVYREQCGRRQEWKDWLIRVRVRHQGH